jgi:tetratricopeptide (TPR) repeat protein
VILAGVTWWIVRMRRPSLVAGWLWFLVMLLPMLAGASLRTSWVSDRYSFLPHMLLFPGVFAALTPRLRVWAGIGAVAILAVTSAAQLSHWRQSETLFAHALSLNPNDAVIRYNFGVALGEQGRFADAAEQYRAALAVHPNYPEAHVNLGAALQVLGDRTGAELHYRAALRLDPNDPDARANLDDLLAGRSAGSKPSSKPS